MGKSSGGGLAATAVMVELAAQAQNRVPVPSYVHLKPDAFQFWDVITSARVASDWRDVDLMTIGKLCNLQVDIQAAQEQLDASGYIIEVEGVPKENPLVHVVDVLTRQYLALSKSVALGRPAGDMRTPLGRGLAAKQLRSVMDDNSGDGLLASG